MTAQPARPPDPLAGVLGPLDGAEIPGGCDTCNAIQTVSVINGIWTITIHHDHDCPTLRRHR